jgi:hypothetical protein
VGAVALRPTAHQRGRVDPALHLVREGDDRPMTMVTNLAVPRTGSVYVQTALSNARPHGHYHLLPGVDWSHAAMTPVPGEWADDVVVGFVRNPFDLLVSVWSMLHRMDALMHSVDREAAQLPFRDWLTLVAHRRHHWPQAYPLHFQLFRPDWSLGVDYLGRFETLDEDLAAIARITGGTHRARDVVNASHRGMWQSYYDEDMLRLVENAWFADLTYFGYHRHGHSPGLAMTTFGENPQPIRHIRARSTTVPWEEQR